MNIIYKLLFKVQKIKFRNFKFKGFPFIFNKGILEFGDNLKINSSFFSNLIGINHRTIIISRFQDSIIKIGNNVGMSGTTIYARKEITIGNNTLIGANVKIFDNDFHPIEIEARNNDIKEKIGTKPVCIGNNCFIGCNSLILKGTELGDGCVVGAGAVVSGKFPENVVIAGNPAKIIKKIENKVIK